VRTAAIRPLGHFDAGAGFFERDFASRFTERGLQTAFFDEIVSVHIGRLTRRAPDASGVSAYELVGDGSHPAAPSLDVRVVNLERRPDRLAAFTAELEERAGTDMARRCRRFPAIDGAALQLTDAVRDQFRGNDFGYRRGVIGCALSHLGLWREVAAADAAACLVFEDDAELAPGFTDALRACLASAAASAPGWELLLLGYHPWRALDEDPEVDAAVRPMRWERFLGGCFAYVVTRGGAQRLAELADRDGIRNGIDWFIMRQHLELDVLEAVPAIASSPIAEPGSDVDSDIQHDAEPVASAPPP
jgi:GR25 family glycosyltransferase involved in LPS biosynthesis